MKIIDASPIYFEEADCDNKQKWIWTVTPKDNK